MKPSAIDTASVHDIKAQMAAGWCSSALIPLKAELQQKTQRRRRAGRWWA